MIFIKKINNKGYEYIIAYILFEIVITKSLGLMGIIGFSSTPYLRLGVICFTILFFIKSIFNIRFYFKGGLKLYYQNVFVLLYFFFALISIVIGIINRNPILYIIIDFLYILLGFIVFYVFENSKQKGSAINYSNYTNYFIALICACLLLPIKTPSVLLVIMVVLMYVNFVKKRYLLVVFLVVPYFYAVIFTNRTQLIVFGVMLFFLLLKRLRNYYSLKSVFLFGLVASLLLCFFRIEILEWLLTVFRNNSSIGYRIEQIIIILQDGADYSDPMLTSVVQRIWEAKAVIDYWTSNVFSFVFGSGSGGVIDGSLIFTDKAVLNSAILGAEKVHNIHLLPFALIFRYGLIGLLLFFLLLLMTYKSSKRILNESNNEQLLFWNLFFVFWFIYSIPAGSFLWTLPIFWMSISFIKPIYEK